MPLYEYRCTSCGYKFEKIQKFSDAPEQVCPKCQGELVRPVTAPALKFEGAGWYINDYAPKAGATAASGDTKSEKSETKPSDASSATPAPAADSTSSAKPAAPSAPSSSSSTTAD